MDIPKTNKLNHSPYFFFWAYHFHLGVLKFGKKKQSGRFIACWGLQGLTRSKSWTSYRPTSSKLPENLPLWCNKKCSLTTQRSSKTMWRQEWFGGSPGSLRVRQLNHKWRSWNLVRYGEIGDPRWETRERSNATGAAKQKREGARDGWWLTNIKIGHLHSFAVLIEGSILLYIYILVSSNEEWCVTFACQPGTCFVSKVLSGWILWKVECKCWGWTDPYRHAILRWPPSVLCQPSVQEEKDAWTCVSPHGWGFHTGHHFLFIASILTTWNSWRKKQKKQCMRLRDLESFVAQKAEVKNIHAVQDAPPVDTPPSHK